MLFVYTDSRFGVFVLLLVNTFSKIMSTNLQLRN